MTRTVVIGAGIAGLATAALLAKDGHEVEVLERLDRVGGRAGTLERDGFRFDTGPSWYLMPRVYDHFFDLLGTTTGEQVKLTTLDPAYRVFSEAQQDGTPSPSFTVPLGVERVLEAFEDREPGAAATLTEYLASAGRASDMAERYFLYNPYTRPQSLLRSEIVTAVPELTRLLVTSLESFVNQRFTDPVLRQVLGYPAVFLGTRPDAAPAMYHLMSALDLGEGVQYPQGGFWELVQRLEALALQAGVTITTEADVIGISTRPTGARRSRRRRVVTGVHWTKDGVTHHSPADIVVSGADLHHTETRLLESGARSYPEGWWRRRTSGPGATLVLLGVRGELPELPHHSLFFTSDWDANFTAIFGDQPRIPDPASIYVCKPSQSDAGVAPPGHENLFVLIPIPADPGLGAGGPDGTGDPLIEQAADAAIAQISAWAGIPDLAERVVVRHTIGPADFARDYHSWMGGMLGPGHLLSQSAMFRAQNASKRVEGLYYAGATTAPGVGIPMCLISAELVLKRIRGDHSPGPTSRAQMGSSQRSGKGV